MSLSKILRFSDPSSIALLGITLMLMLMGFIYFYSMASSSNSSAPKKEESSSNSTSSIQKRFKYDVFLSFRGEDTRKNFVDHLYHALKDKGMYTYKDDEKIKKGERINDELIKAIEDSKFYIIVFSKNYASSSWCLEELVKIMECQKMTTHTAYPLFYDVEPTEVRKQSGAVGKAFAKHEKEEDAGKWREALKEAADLAGWELKNTLDGHQAKFIKKVVQEISLELRSIYFGFDEKLVGMETRVKEVVSSLKVGIDEARMIGIKGMGGAGKTTTARAVFDYMSIDFEAKSFVENVREVSTTLGLKKLQEQVLSDVLNEHVTVNGVTDGKNMMKERMHGKKVLLVLDDVDHIEQLKALAGEPKWFKPGSRILITTRDEQVLVAHRVNLILDIVLLSKQEAISLFSRYAFGRENPLEGYKMLSRKVVRYAAGLPLTIEVLGSFLCGKDKDEWEDAIERLKNIPLKETLVKLELSYVSLEDDYKEIFLDTVCMLKGKRKTDAISILESCGFHARNGLKVLEQRSLITISKDKYGILGMHDHIEEMGKNIVRRLHPDEPNKHSRLWIKEEIEDILANDMGSEATRCLRHDKWRGLGKMKKLRYLEMMFANYDFEFDDTTQYFPNSLKYIKCRNYPFLYLPKTFQANNLVGLEMEHNQMVQLWEEGEKKVLKKLKFLSLLFSDLATFDFRITPNLETLSLKHSYKLVELCMPVSCQKLKHLVISESKLKFFDIGLTPNLETLSLLNCTHFVKLQVSVACPNLKFLKLNKVRLRSFELELIPNLERLDLRGLQLVEINAPVGCLKKAGHFACTDFKKFSDMICSLRCLRKLKLECNIPEFPKDLGQLECLERLHVRSKKIEFLPDSICMLKRLKFLMLDRCALLEKLPEDFGLLECLKVLVITDTCISHLPQSISGLKGLLIAASLELLQLYDFPSEIKTTSPSIQHEAKFVKKDVEEISLELRSINFGFVEKLVGMPTLAKYVVSSLEDLANEVCMIGIKGMRGAGKTTTARAVFDHLSNDFEAKIFVGNVREVSKASIFGLKNLQEQVLSKVLNEHVTLDSVDDGKDMMKKRMCGKKVLLVLDDVDHIDQLKALAGEPKWFKPGSRILITTRDVQVLVAHRVNLIFDMPLLSEQEAIRLFSRYAFGRENPVQGYEELSRKAVRYAAGLPTTIVVLASFLCGKDMVEWEDAIERLKSIPLKETLEKLELRYNSQSLGFII